MVDVQEPETQLPGMVALVQLDNNLNHFNSYYFIIIIMYNTFSLPPPTPPKEEGRVKKLIIECGHYYISLSI